MNKQWKRVVRILGVCSMIVACLALPCEADETDSSAAETAGLRERLSGLQKKIDRVSIAIERAEGFPKTAGRIDVQIARFFAEYIVWELDHPELMKEALVSHDAFNTPVEVDRSERARRYLFHIERELSGSEAVLDQALARLGREVQWPRVPDIQWSQMAYEKGFFRVKGRPVFPEGFNMLERSMVDLSKHPEWAGQDEALTRSFLQEMQQLGVGLLGVGVSVPGLIMEDGRISGPGIRDLAEKIRRHERIGFKVDILLGWSGERKTLERLWPGITQYYGNGVRMDIDHPGAKEMIARVMAELMPALKDLPAILSWDLANEPFFSLDQWSPHSLDNYRAWLARQYTTVERLNAVWKTTYPSFKAIPLPKERPRKRCSAGEWYDRVTFHNERVATFFERVQREIRKYSPDAVIHLKGQDNSSLGPLPEAVVDGIDRERLTRMSTLQGVDTRPLPVTEPRMAAVSRNGDPETILDYDGSLYGFHWLGQSFLYDYLTSLEPRQPIVDFEYHAFSINAIRIPDIPPGHARAALWMAHLHGLIGNMAWYWHRRYGPDPFPGHYFRMWLSDSLSTQPLAAAEYFQTMLGLNAFSEEVSALAAVPDRPVRLFVSQPSYCQNQAHINALHRAYEGACFHGVRLGVVTERMLAEGGMPRDCSVLIIPDAEYVSAAALQVLQQAAKKGVRLVRFGKRKVTYDDHGIPHKPTALAFLEQVQVVDAAAAPEVSREFGRLLLPLTAALPLQVSRVDGRGAFGVMHRQAQVDGQRIVLLVNLSDKPVRVRIHSQADRAVNGYDMLNQEAVEGKGSVLQVQGVRLIRFSL